MYKMFSCFVHFSPIAAVNTLNILKNKTMKYHIIQVMTRQREKPFFLLRMLD